MASSAREFWIFGASGQLGRAWLTELNRRGLPARAFVRPELELEQASSIDTIFQEIQTGSPLTRPAAVVLTGAYTQVDRAELPEEKSRVLAVNGLAPGHIASSCARLGIPFIHYSTDYVYPGSGELPRSEDAPVEPLNEYGRTKLEGERHVQAAFEGASSPWLIFRTSWVYDAQGKNFFRTMLRLFGEKDSLSVVEDQWGAPSYAPHLARASLDAFFRTLENPRERSGVYHLVNQGFTSWHGFASAILKQAQLQGAIKLHALHGISSQNYPTPARRPLNSRLSTALLKERLGIELPTWEQGLRDCWTALYGSPKGN